MCSWWLVSGCCWIDHFDDAGIRGVRTCNSNQTYFSLIDECVEVEIAVLPMFLDAILVSHVCAGRVVRTLDDLEAIRTCDVINGSLTIALNDANADFTALYDIKVIQGLTYVLQTEVVELADMIHMQDRSQLLEAA
jgi:hypothetical protein